MVSTFVIKSVIEAVMVVLLIVGFINEEKVVDFERTLFRAVVISVKLRKQRRAKRRLEQSVRPSAQLKALMALPSEVGGGDTTRAA